MLPPFLKYSQNRLQKYSCIKNRHGKEKQLQSEITIFAVENMIKIFKILKVHWGSIFLLLYSFVIHWFWQESKLSLKSTKFCSYLCCSQILFYFCTYWIDKDTRHRQLVMMTTCSSKFVKCCWKECTKHYILLFKEWQFCCLTKIPQLRILWSFATLC